jgi:hypothetical protein
MNNYILPILLGVAVVATVDKKGNVPLPVGFAVAAYIGLKVL